MKKLLIDRFSAFILGSGPWGQIQAIVKILEDSTLTGPERRVQAIDKAKDLGLNIAGFLLNLGLELAVARIRL